jgi:hypothetical protein
MHGIVRGVHASAGRFYAECSDGTFALFTVAGGRIPYGGEFVCWESEKAPIEMVTGGTSGSIQVKDARVGLTLLEAQYLIALP